MRAFLSLMAACLALLLTAAPAQAASYDFPSAMPAGCSGSNGSYTCSTGSLAWGDTVTLSGTRPATITVSGDLQLNGAKINQAGSAGDLTLVVLGKLTPGYQAVVNGSVQANEIDDISGAVTFGANLRATGGPVRLAFQTRVAGSVTADRSNVEIADEVVVRGDISASAQVSTAFRSQVGGSITAGGQVTIGQENTVGGTVVAGGNGNIDVGYGAVVQGDIRSQAGTVTLAQSAVAKACVQTLTSSRAITLGYQASIGGVCCGNQGSCSNSCVLNNSTTATPALCAVPAGAGLTGSYFSNTSLTAPAALERVDGTVGFDWVNGGPATGLPVDRFSVRWVGYLRVPTAGSYRFQTRSDDGVRLWVDGVQLVNNWADHGATLDTSSAVALSPGVDYPLTMEFYENGGLAVAGLHWLKPGDAAYTIIPPGTVERGGLFTAPQTRLIARFDFDEASYTGSAGELKDTAGFPGGPFHGMAQGATLPSTATTSPARPGSPGTCGYASLPGPTGNGGQLQIGGLPLATSTGAKTTVAFWMYWDGSNSVMPLGWRLYDLWFQSGHFGFNTSNSDVYGIASTGLAKGWRHVVAVFTNGSVTDNKLYIDGVAQTLTQRLGTPIPSAAVVGPVLNLGGWSSSTGFRMGGRLDQLRVYNGEVSAAQVAALVAETHSCAVVPLHHLELLHASGTGLTCTPSTVTVRACQDAACSTLYTGGVSGMLGAAGGSVVWPATAAFSIAAGSSSIPVSLQATTTTATVLGVASSSLAPSSAASCNFGSPSCTFTAADAGFVFDVPNHVSEVNQTVNVSAVRKSDNSNTCTPAFASRSKAVTFTCGYTNPASGTLPVRVGGAALNAAGNAAAACDSTGRAVSLAFNGNGVASTTVQYADVGRLLLSASYNGAASSGDAGLVMTGSDAFIAAPQALAVTGVPTGPIKAGSPFAATVSARNAAGAVAPNFARESPAESVSLGWVRLQPTGVGTVNGSFSGSLGSFASGSASASNLAWTEVGRGDLLARLTSNNYLGSGLGAFGSSVAQGALHCADEGGACTLPTGATATVYYGNNASYAVKTGVSGSVACSNGVFGDPLQGVVKKCWYVGTAATNGSVGDFIAHHFDVTATAACGAFSYAGQPFSAQVTARNAGNATTLNFDGSASVTPSFAQAVSLSDGGPLALGTMSGDRIAATAFAAGVATATPSYAFTSKSTAPQTLVLRAANDGSGSAAISSAGYTEASMPLRSGRLRLSNAFGSASAALQLPVVAEHWSGNAWVLNSADSCTAVAAGSVALSNPRNAAGGASTATSSAGAIALINGRGLLTLAAPAPIGSSLSLDLAINLGGTAADQSCQVNHPASTGAAKAWLRAQNGSCATTADRDPAARASFGIFSPESRKTVHVRELF